MQKIHQKLYQKTNAHLSLNPLTKNTYNKYENVVSNYYMMRNTSKIALKNDAKNQSQQQLTWKKIVTWSCVSRALKSVVLGNLDQSM